MAATLRSRPAFWPTALLLMCLVACTGGDGGSAAAGPATNASSPRSGEPTGDGSTPRATTPESPADSRCRAQERRIVRRIAYPMQLATADLMRSLGETSMAAARRVAARAELARRAVLEECARPSAEMRAYVAVARRRSGDVLTHRDLDAVMRAYAAWAEHVGQGNVARKLMLSQQGCRELKRHVEASYRVWWRWTERGRLWWIQLTYRSRLDRPLSGFLHGRVRVTHLLDEELWTSEGHRRAGVMTWGGSSADGAFIRPGESRQLVAPGAGPYIHTAGSGVFDVQRVEVSVGVPGLRSWWCALPVPERS